MNPLAKTRRGERCICDPAGCPASLAQGPGRNDGADRQAGSRPPLSSFGPNARSCDAREHCCNRICSDRPSAVRQTRRKERGTSQGTQADHRAGAADRARQVLRPGPRHRGGAEVLPRGRSHRKRQEGSDQSLAGDQFLHLRQRLFGQRPRDRQDAFQDRTRAAVVHRRLFPDHRTSRQRDYHGSLAERLASTREGGGKQVRGGARLSHQGRADRHGFRILRLPR